jgi:uncharacterized protein (DUF983 family)
MAGAGATAPVAEDLRALHGRPCPACDSGRLRVLEGFAVVSVSCDRCACPGLRLARLAGLDPAGLLKDGEVAAGRTR